ncbi:hypothetical protein FRC04_009960 [Tulasnella sp. 424]|nr:hypothetical protein FRC04_009960 [Tulasnella sp. 424]KAG8971517.1 hypothetical protein FRC05_010994 [Tulasnella sp. 425]
MRFPIILFTLITSTLAAQEAQVYFLPPNPTQHHQAPALNPTEANTLISHHLGLDVYENLPDQVEGWWHKVTGWVYGNVVTSGVGQGQQDSVLIVIQSDHPEDFIPSDMKQSFIIPDAPSASMFTDLIHAYTERASHLFDSVFSSLSPFLASIKETPAYKQLLDIFDLAGEGAKHFVEEFGRLVEWVDEEIEGKSKATSSPDEDKFSAFEVKGLAELEKAQGRESEQYITAAKSMQAVLSNPNLQNRQVAIVVVPPETSRRQKRAPQSAADSSLLTASNNKVVFSTSTCFKSNETCTDKTSGCSGHGSCNPVTIAGKTCYTCSCAVTKNDKGRRQWWAGQACERLDMSTPFTLLAGTALALIVLVVFSVGLLQAVGSEQLPNTLTAAASAHPKRE